MNTYKQLKCKILSADSIDMLECNINEFICEEVEECEVKDIKFSITESAEIDLFYAFILYYWWKIEDVSPMQDTSSKNTEEANENGRHFQKRYTINKNLLATFFFHCLPFFYEFVSLLVRFQKGFFFFKQLWCASFKFLDLFIHYVSLSF